MPGETESETAPKAPTDGSPSPDSVADMTLDQIQGLADKARASLDTHGIPPTPQNYTLWFSYHAQENLALVRTLDGILAEGLPFSRGRLKALFEEHFGGGQEAATMSRLGGRLQTALTRVMTQIGAASADTEGPAPTPRAMTGPWPSSSPSWTSKTSRNRWNQRWRR